MISKGDETNEGFPSLERITIRFTGRDIQTINTIANDRIGQPHWPEDRDDPVRLIGIENKVWEHQLVLGVDPVILCHVTYSCESYPEEKEVR